VQDLRHCTKELGSLHAVPHYTLDPGWVQEVVGADNAQMLLVLQERYRRLRVARKRRCAHAPLALLQSEMMVDSSVDSKHEFSAASAHLSGEPSNKQHESSSGHEVKHATGEAISSEVVIRNRSDDIAESSVVIVPPTMPTTAAVTAPPTLSTTVPPAIPAFALGSEEVAPTARTPASDRPVLVPRLALPMAQPSRVEQQGPPSLPPADQPEFDIESLLIATTVDGRLVAINARSGRLRWESKVGSPLLLYHRSRHKRFPHWLPSLEGELWVMVQGEVRLRKAEMSVNDFIQHAPFVTERGLLHLGEIRSSFFEIDPFTGQTRQHLDSRGGRSSRLHPTKHTLQVRRVDRTVRALALDDDLSDDSWNITVASIKLGAGRQASADEVRRAFQSAPPFIVMSKNGNAKFESVLSDLISLCSTDSLCGSQVWHAWTWWIRRDRSSELDGRCRWPLQSRSCISTRVLSTTGSNSHFKTHPI
jgi:hypothetical protein